MVRELERCHTDDEAVTRQRGRGSMAISNNYPPGDPGKEGGPRVVSRRGVYLNTTPCQGVDYHEAEVELGRGIAVVGGLPIPLPRLGVVLRDAFALAVHGAEDGLGAGVALVGGLSKPLHHLGVVLREAVAMAVHEAEVVLGAGIALLGERAEFLQSRCVVAPLIGSPAFVEASPRRTDEHDENDSRYRDAIH